MLYNDVTDKLRNIKFRQLYKVDSRGLLMRKDRYYVPGTYKVKVLQYYHDNILTGGHVGKGVTIQKTRKKIVLV